MGRTTRASGVFIRPVASATITDVFPTEGHVSGNVTVTVNGYGFINSNELKCRWSSKNLRLFSPAKWVSYFGVLCLLPTALDAFAIPTFLSVSQDGAIFPQSQVEFNITGPGAALMVSTGLLHAVSAGGI